MLLLLAGCASYSQSQHTIQQSLINQNPAQALELLDKKKNNGSDQFLYHTDRAMLLRMLGKYAESNAEIEIAKKLVEEFSATSITEQGAAFLINDATRTYTGTPVEQIMLHVYAALNYLELGQPDSARVEILQVDTRLRGFMQDDPDSPLSFDPFARYLSGIIYEDMGEWSDAMIAYRKSYKAYQAHQDLYSIGIPAQLKSSLILMAHKIGLSDEQKKYEQAFNLKILDLLNARKNQSELVFMFHNGLAPVKREHAAQIFSPVAGRLIRIAVPGYYRRDNSISRVRINIQNQNEKTNQYLYSATSEVTEDISSLAIKTLESYMPAITARALARAVAKYKMAKDAGDKNPMAGLLVNLVGFVTERADTRSWLSLPAEIQTARLPLPPGNYRLIIELLGYNNHVVSQQTVENVQVKKSQKHYLSFHWTASSLNHGLAGRH
ncbi:MAG: hypothetical protein OQK73_05335 [Gammaproteobacteria bacterium]|nr:hypothetical protein [Gammaproteobacteria bacterium]